MRIKKLLATLIVMVLVSSLIPTVFAEETVNYNYVFSSSAHDLGENPTTAERRLISGLHSIDNMSENTSSAPWGFVNGYKFNALATYSGYMNWGLSDDKNAGVVFAPGEADVNGVRAALAFEISASAGVYDASLSINATENPTELEIYLVPKNENNILVTYDGNNSDASKESFYRQIEAISANYRIGKIDLYNKNGDVHIGRTELSQSDYYLVLVPCGVNENAVRNGSWTMQITNFKLDSANGAGINTYDKEFSPADAFAYKNSSASYGYSKDDVTGAFSTENLQVRRYGVTLGWGSFAAFKVNVGVTGKYNLSFKTSTVDDTQAAPAVYLSEKSSEDLSRLFLEDITDKTLYGYFVFSELTAVDTYRTVTTNGLSSGALAELPLEANKDYYIILAPDGKSLSLNGKTTTRTLVEGTDYLVPKTGAITDKDGAVFANNSFVGVQKLFISGIKLTQVVEISEEEKERQEAYEADRELYESLTSISAENNTVNSLDSYSSTATVTVVAQDIVTGESVASDIENSSVAVNTEYRPTLPSVGDEYEFMYWAVGLGVNRKIVSFNKDEYSFKAAPGRNMVYAVYRKTNNDTKYAFFFDGSRTVMGKKAISDGQVTLPSLPGVMPGFGEPTGWKYTGEENEEALPEATEISDLEEDTFFVAAYNDMQTVAVTIDGQEINVPYGTEINLGDYASIRENKTGENVFNCWKKGEEIISFKPDYDFLAYEDCIITSTYGKYEPLDKTIRRILMSEDETTGITFAEFIGLDTAVEKGILFGDAKTTYADASVKVVMQTDADVFSVVSETEKDAIGYAILGDGSIVYSDR